MKPENIDEVKPVRRDTTLAPHVDATLTAYASLTGRSISSCLAMAAERGLLCLADDLRRARKLAGMK
jgi:hypothetical protein